MLQTKLLKIKKDSYILYEYIIFMLKLTYSTYTGPTKLRNY